MHLLETPCFQNFTLLVGGDVFFLLHPMKEGEEEDRDGCCTLDVQEFGYRGTPFFKLGSSRKVSFHNKAKYQGEYVG